MACALNVDKKEDILLYDIFLEGWNILDELQVSTLPCNSAEFQEKVKKSIDRFEQATLLVNQVEMFSSNELIEEVSTDSIQYLLLPFFLARVTLKLNSVDRLETLQISEIYLRDFIKRCREYSVCEGSKEMCKNADCSDKQTELDTLIQAAYKRNEKITQFRKRRELEEYVVDKIESVKNRTADDESRRLFFLKLLNKSIIDAKEELESVKLEKKLAEMRNIENEVNKTTPEVQNKSKIQQTKTFKPFIITRNNAQKTVFGLGYPSVPVMTVGDFYQQRVDEGVFPDGEKVKQLNEQRFLDQSKDQQNKDDRENIAAEELLENDDPDNMERLRRQDEYKDIVRRGDGNRYNRS